MMSNQDLLYRYLFEEYEVRGELVQLDRTYRHIIDAQNYPVQVQHLLGELLVATSLLTATPSSKAPSRCSCRGTVRYVWPSSTATTTSNCAAWHATKGLPTDGKLQSLIGNGHLVINHHPGSGRALSGHHRPGRPTPWRPCLEHYAQSEQLATRLWIRTGHHEGEPPCGGHPAAGAAGPERGSQRRFRPPGPAHHHHQGRRAVRSGRGRDPLPPLPPGQGTGVRSPGHRVPLHLLPRPLKGPCCR